MPHIESILALANATITITHRTETPRIDGKTQAPTISTETAIAVVVPASGDQLKRLPEGCSTVGLYSIYTTTEITAGSVGFLSDLVTYNSDEYELEKVDKYDNHFGETFYDGLMRIVK